MLNSFCVCCEGGVHLNHFACGYSVTWHHLLKRSNFFLLNHLNTLANLLWLLLRRRVYLDLILFPSLIIVGHVINVCCPYWMFYFINKSAIVLVLVLYLNRTTGPFATVFPFLNSLFGFISCLSRFYGQAIFLVCLF